MLWLTFTIVVIQANKMSWKNLTFNLPEIIYVVRCDLLSTASVVPRCSTDNVPPPHSADAGLQLSTGLREISQGESPNGGFVKWSFAKCRWQLHVGRLRGRGLLELARGRLLQLQPLGRGRGQGSYTYTLPGQTVHEGTSWHEGSRRMGEEEINENGFALFLHINWQISAPTKGLIRL